MQQRFLFQILLLAQHVSGTTMPISWGLCVRFAGCCSILQTGNITHSSTPDQQLENHSTKYHRQQPPYNTLELLMMGIVVPETCWASNKIRNKNLCYIYLAFYFHILTTMHGQNHIRFSTYIQDYTVIFSTSHRTNRFHFFKHMKLQIFAKQKVSPLWSTNWEQEVTVLIRSRVLSYDTHSISFFLKNGKVLGRRIIFRFARNVTLTFEFILA